MICLTLDLEWAPTSVLRETRSLLQKYNIDLTLFSTHDDNVDFGQHERALHPNFLLENATEEEILADIASLYPDARGIRSHSLYIHSKLRSLYTEYGITYESNYLMYRVSGISPFEMGNEIIQFPVYFMDDTWLERREGDIRLDAETLLGQEGLKILDFHPPHICFNTPSIEYYETHKDAYWETDPDIETLRCEGYGVRRAFLEILEYIEAHDLKTATLGELATEHREQTDS